MVKTTKQGERGRRMIACEQKYCKNCIKPCFGLDGKFIYGHCKISRYIRLQSGQKETMLYDVQPLYCGLYEQRKRKIKY